MGKVKINDVKRLFDGHFKLDQALVQYEKPDGELTEEISRLNFVPNNPVVVLVYDKTNNYFIMTRQFRYGVYAVSPQDAYMIEIIAQAIRGGEVESVISAVEKETGITLNENNIEKIGEFYVSPGGSSELIQMYYAGIELQKDFKTYNKNHRTDNKGDYIEVVYFSPNQVDEMIKHGLLKDAKTILAFNWWLSRKAKK